MTKTKKNIRKVSFDVLFDVLVNKKLLNNVINEEFENGDISDDDKAYVKRECNGVIENIDRIDAVINKYSKVKVNKLNDDILIVLRIAIYEFIFMDRVPAYATLNESVNIIKKSKSAKLSGYVNAVLRNILRDENFGIKAENNVNDIRRCYFKTFNGGNEIVLKELNERNVVYHKYDGKLDFKLSDVYYTDNFKSIIELTSFKKGYIIIEDASSAYLVDRLSNLLKDKNISVLDTCSAPGGKILSLIDLMGKRIVYAEARDISSDKIDKIKENAKRLNINSLKYGIKDASVLEKDDIGKYDLVMCDVPCTGLGVINKKPDIKLNFNEEKLKSLVEIQRQILDVSKNYVKNGGILSYSTCTVTREENEENISWFKDNNKEFDTIFEKRIELNDKNLADGFYMNIMEKH